MADAALEVELLSAEDYLARENDGAWRHEFVNGAVYAMVGSSDRHNLIALNLASLLSTRLPDRCQVFSTDMKLHVRSAADERFYYPDVFVSCSPNDRDRFTREEPTLIVEVLSPTTERIDRSEKFEAYTKLPSLQEYALIAQDRVHLELYRRRAGWTRQTFGQGEEVTFESVGLTLPLTSLYRRTDIDGSSSERL